MFRFFKVCSGKVVSESVSLVDLLPTFVDIGGGEANLEGTSLLKISRDLIDRDVFSEYFAEASIGPRFMIKSGKWKFIYSEVTFAICSQFDHIFLLLRILLRFCVNIFRIKRG